MNQAPRACFAYGPNAKAKNELGDELAGALGTHLLSKYGNAEMIRKWFIPGWMIVLRASVNSFMIYLVRNKFKTGEWIVHIGHLDDRHLWKILRGPEHGENKEELSLVASELHSALVHMNNVSDLRWYFETHNILSAAVETPDDLPWEVNA